MKRAEEVTTTEDLKKKEMRHLVATLRGNGYPANMVKPMQRKKDVTPNDGEEERKPLTTAIIPYTQGLSEQIKRVLRTYNIRTAFRSGVSLANLLTKVKDPVLPEDREGVVYKIRCLCGDFYIGQTGRNTNTRIKEHKAACRLAKFESSAVAEHAWQDGHIIEWDQVEIVDTATATNERLVKEAIHIRLAPRGCRINREEGRELSLLWMNAVRSAREHSRRRTMPSLQPHPPTTPPPRIVRPTPSLRRRMSHATDYPTTLASATPTGVGT